MSKIISIIIVLVLIGGGVYIVSTNPASTGAPQEVSPEQVATTTTATSTSVSVPVVSPVVATTTTPKPVKATTTPVSSTPKTTSYTRAEVSAHSTKSDCWSIVNNKVYNLTSWIGQHPGGQQAILSMCGKDGTAGFEDQHGGERRPANELAGFYIGDLK